VRKGEKGTPVVFFKKLEVEDTETGEDKLIPMLKKFTVFNMDQIDGIEAPDIEPRDPDAEPTQPMAVAEAIYKGYVLPPKLKIGGVQAMYDPTNDVVNMPEAERFPDGAIHASTLFHELVHSTGHSKRLDRKLDTRLAPYGSPDYSREELIAECGAAFLCASTSILPETIEQSASYIDGWRRRLKDDKTLIVRAAAAGQKAADHILGQTWDDASGEMKPTAPKPPESQAQPADESETGKSIDRDLVELKTRHRKMMLALRTLAPPPRNLDLGREADLEQLRTYGRRVQQWYNNHIDYWIESGILKKDPRANWCDPQPQAEHDDPPETGASGPQAGLFG